MKRLILIFNLLIAGTIIAGCGEDKVTLNPIARKMGASAAAPSLQVPFSPQTPDASSTPVVSPALTNIRRDYESYVQPLVQKACMDCHDSHAVPDGFIGHLPIVKGVEWKHIKEASAALDFSKPFPNWSSTSSDPNYYFSQLKGVLETHIMPPNDYKIVHELDGKLLKDFENQVILNWIKNAEQELSAVSTTPPANPSHYFERNCVGCHNSNYANGGFQFQKSGEQWVVPAGKSSAGIPYLSPRDPKNSAVYLVLLTDASQRKKLLEMPYGGQASAEDQKLIYDWIQSGAGLE